MRGGISVASRHARIFNQRAFMRVLDPTEDPLQDVDLLQRQAYGRFVRVRDEDGRESVYRVAFGEREALRYWLIATRERSPHYSMAVLCPDAARAQMLERALHDELWARNILTAATDSQTDAARLCESYFVHFTTPMQSKGLEFDVVFVLDVDRYDLSTASEQGALYVALSRPRRRLGIGATASLPAVLDELFQRHLGPAPELS